MPSLGRFLTRDTWDGNANRPMSFNRWGYAYDNPVRFIDPTGLIPEYCTHIYMGSWPRLPGCAEEFDKLFGLNLLNKYATVNGSWSVVDKAAARDAAWIVGIRLAQTRGGFTTPYGEFRKVYGIRDDRLMFFEMWGDIEKDGCYGCRSQACQDADLWIDDTYYDEDGKLQYRNIPGTNIPCACKPKGAYTRLERQIQVASLWPNFTGHGSYWQNVRKTNNMIHELGHAFNQRAGLKPQTAVGNFKVKIKNEYFYLTDRSKGFYEVGPGTMTWQQSNETTGSEIFADMFLGWAYNKWATDAFGDARKVFMDTNMKQWIKSAISKP